MQIKTVLLFCSGEAGLVVAERAVEVRMIGPRLFCGGIVVLLQGPAK